MITVTPTPGKEAGVAGTSPDVVSPECNGRPVLQTHLSTIWSRRQQAVCVRHAFKHYGSSKNPNHVLENLNMTVSKGTIKDHTIPRLSLPSVAQATSTNTYHSMNQTSLGGSGKCLHHILAPGVEGSCPSICKGQYYGVSPKLCLTEFQGFPRSYPKLSSGNHVEVF
uniref:Uncharacterized protein n=1 Tax=Timema douglasi TaxID=61478 RepID=A0A7R8VG13_TIMDO|nr:unnamed protein product [Timema douglasi]